MAIPNSVKIIFLLLPIGGIGLFFLFSLKTDHPKAISYTQARQYAGSTKTVEGELKEVFNNRAAVYLGFQKPHNGVFVVKILKSAWPNFPTAPESLYQVGQTIQVTGQIVWYQGDPAIYVTNPTHIKVLTN